MSKKLGSVKWYNETKGYGFLVVEGVEKDVFIHIKRLRESGISEPVKEGEKFSCVVNDGPRGLFATELSRGP